MIKLQKHSNKLKISSANIDALLFMQKSYEALLMKENARDIEKIILTNILRN